MRITPEVLQRIAADAVERRIKQDRDVLAAFIHGSALSEDPVLSGTADIDLFFIHVNPVTREREIERLTDDVHLDIAHQERRLYGSSRQIRLDPWLGPVVNGCKILYDPQHFLDFIQAGVRAQFDRPENVLRRSRQQAEQARQTWLRFQIQPPQADPNGISEYFEAVANAANAVAVLNGPLLTERRFLLQFTERAAAVDRPGMLAGLLGLLGGAQASLETVQALLPQWRAAFEALPESQAPIRLHPHRFHYYYRFFEQYAGAEGDFHMILWPLLRTWTDMARIPSAAAGWEEAVLKFGLAGEQFPQRLEALDAYLDTVDELLDHWGGTFGI